MDIMGYPLLDIVEYNQEARRHTESGRHRSQYTRLASHAYRVNRIYRAAAIISYEDPEAVLNVFRKNIYVKITGIISPNVFVVQTIDQYVFPPFGVNLDEAREGHYELVTIPRGTTFKCEVRHLGGEY